MAISYVASSNITVYPSGFRGEGYAQSKLMTEENVRNIKLLSKNYKNNNWIMEDPLASTYVIIQIAGAIFRLAKSNIPAKQYCALKFRNISSPIGDVIDNFATSGSALDDGTNFKGLAFGAESDFSSIDEKHKLKIRSSNSSSESTLLISNPMKLDSDEIRNGDTNDSISQTFTTGTLNAPTINTSSINSTSGDRLSLNANISGNAATATSASSASSATTATWATKIYGSTEAGGTIKGKTIGSGTDEGKVPIALKDGEFVAATADMSVSSALKSTYTTAFSTNEDLDLVVGDGNEANRVGLKFKVYDTRTGQTPETSKYITVPYAIKASKLANTEAVGGGTRPVYFSAEGVPVACTYTLEKSVPSNAEFKDTKNTAGVMQLGSNYGYVIASEDQGIASAQTFAAKKGIANWVRVSGSGNIEATGGITCGSLDAGSGTIVTTGAISGASLTTTGAISGSNINITTTAKKVKLHFVEFKVTKPTEYSAISKLYVFLETPGTIANRTELYYSLVANRRYMAKGTLISGTNRYEIYAIERGTESATINFYFFGGASEGKLTTEIESNTITDYASADFILNG